MYIFAKELPISVIHFDSHELSLRVQSVWIITLSLSLTSRAHTWQHFHAPPSNWHHLLRSFPVSLHAGTFSTSSALQHEPSTYDSHELCGLLLHLLQGQPSQINLSVLVCPQNEPHAHSCSRQQFQWRFVDQQNLIYHPILSYRIIPQTQGNPMALSVHLVICLHMLRAVSSNTQVNVPLRFKESSGM